MAKIVSNYVDVFKERLHKEKKRIKRELEKPKSDRDKRILKERLAEVKSIKKLLKQVKHEQDTMVCPNCGHKCS